MRQGGGGEGRQGGRDGRDGAVVGGLGVGPERVQGTGCWRIGQVVGSRDSAPTGQIGSELVILDMEGEARQRFVRHKV